MRLLSKVSRDIICLATGFCVVMSPALAQSRFTYRVPLPSDIGAPPKQGKSTLSTSLVDFGATGVGRLAASQNVSIQNVGNANLAISLPALATSPFSVTSDCSVLAPRSSCSVKVGFGPNTRGEFTQPLVIETSSGPQAVELRGSGIVGSLSYSAQSLVFAEQQVLVTSAAQPVVLKNSGYTSLAINSVSFLNGGAHFRQSNDCGTLAPGATCTTFVSYEPAAAGAATGVLQVLHDGDGATQVSLAGSAVAPSGQLTAPVYAAAVQVGNAGAGTATIRNTGLGPLTVPPISASSVSGTNFAFKSSTCAPVLAATQSCTATYEFTPTASGVRTGSLSISTGAGVLTASFNATGTQGQAVANVSDLAFGNQQIGESATKTLVLSNPGTAPLSVSSVSTGNSDASFSQSHNCTTVPKNGSCTVSVSFLPTNAGPVQGTLSIAHNGGAPITATLSGDGKAPSAALSTLSIPLTPVGGTSTATTTLSNTGTGVLTVGTPVVSGTGYSLDASACTATLAPSASCRITVKFAPLTTVNQTGTVTVLTGAGSKTTSTTAAGAQASLSLSKTALAFGSITVGSSSAAQSVTLTNSGTWAVAVPSIYFSSGAANFQVSNTASCATINPSSSCTVSVVMAPSVSTAISGTLSFVPTGLPSMTVTTSGTGTPAPVYSFGVSASGLNFGSITTGSQTSTTVTVSNTGNQPLSFSPVALISGAADFSTSSGCGYLAVGATCSVSVTFRPAAAGGRDGAFNLTAANASTRTISLYGTGTSPAPQPAAVVFSPGAGSTLTVRVHDGDSVSDEVVGTVNIRNSGGSPLTLNAAISDPYGPMYVGGCPSSLAAGASCTLSVRFHLGMGGGSEGIKTGYALSVTTNVGSASFPIYGEYLWN